MPLSVWSGTVWQAAAPRVWNGTAWVTPTHLYVMTDELDPVTFEKIWKRVWSDAPTSIGERPQNFNASQVGPATDLKVRVTWDNTTLGATMPVEIEKELNGSPAGTQTAPAGSTQWDYNPPGHADGDSLRFRGRYVAEGGPGLWTDWTAALVVDDGLV